MANELITKKNRRVFLQSGGALPGNPTQYAGQGSTYLKIESVERPRLGGADVMYNHDPNRVGSYIPVATMIKPPDTHSFSVTYRLRKGGVPYSHIDLTCPSTFYAVSGDCRNLSDFDGGWSDFVQILPGAIATKISDGDLNDFEEDKELETKVDYSCAARLIYSVGSLYFGLQGVTGTATPFKAICYGNTPQCGDCGVADDGTRKVYAVAAGGVGAPPLVWYSLDGGQTWTSSSISVAANAEAPNDIIVVGSYLVVLSPTANTSTNGGYYYIPLDNITGAPSGTWTKVTSGFVDQKAPQDMFLQNQTLWIVGKAGYIYKVTDVTSGATVNNAGATVTTDLLRIHGSSDGGQNVLVATGASSVILKSVNGGATWAATTTTPTAGAHNVGAVCVINSLVYWVGTITGTNTGRLYYTKDGGVSWTEKGFTGNGAGTLTDIVAANPECIYFAHNTAAPTARVFASINGGQSFTNVAPRIGNLPAHNLATRLALPMYSGPTAIANNVAIAGTASGGTDGVVLLGVAATV